VGGTRANRNGHSKRLGDLRVSVWWQSPSSTDCLRGVVTPIEAFDDVCAAFSWARETESLGITGRIAGYGVSAGAHLVTLTVTRGCSLDPEAELVGPEALLLWSPALDLPRYGWFRKLLQGRATAEQYSPVEFVLASTPPTSIVIGEKDTLTPLSGAESYCKRLVEAGGICDLNVYERVGHLLTRNLGNQESDFDPDPDASADAVARHLEFLVEQGFISKQ